MLCPCILPMRTGSGVMELTCGVSWPDPALGTQPPGWASPPLRLSFPSAKIRAHRVMVGLQDSYTMGS